MIPKGHGEAPTTPIRAPRTPSPTKGHPGDTRRDIPEDDLSLQIPRPATNSKTVNRLESAPR